MYIDIFGKARLKLGLHTHTTLSDGAVTPSEAAKIYLDAGYDAIALTDHWIFQGEDEIEGLRILPGCEYNFGGGDSSNSVYHIVGLGMTSDPCIPVEWRDLIKTSTQKAIETIDMIKLHNGLPVLAHPAWSLNTVEQMQKLGNFEALEIYNSVSEAGMSDRPYSGLLSDMLFTKGKIVPLIAADDTHYYRGEQGRGFVMVEATDFDTQSIIRALRAGRFYSSQGPEIHIRRVSDTKVKVFCSPSVKVVFLSNLVWTNGRVVRGEDIIEAEYSICPGEKFIRAEVTDAEGRMAWSNAIVI